MNWIFEQPQLIVLFGVALLLALGAAWSATGRKELVVAIIGTFFLMVLGLVAERIVVTDSEAIRATLLEIARDVQSNSLRALLAHVASASPELKKKAEAEMPKYRFTECRVTKIHKIDVDAKAKPKTANVEFNVIASGSVSEAGMELSDTAVPRWIRLHMLREADGRWTVQDYEHAPPQQMLFRDESAGNGQK